MIHTVNVAGANRDRSGKTGILAAVLAASVLLVGGAHAGPPQDEERFFVEFRQHGRDSARTVREAGGRPVHEFPQYGLVAAWLSPKARERLSQNPNVASIEEDPKRYPYAESVPYGIPMVQADQVSDGAAANRRVCIIDSGYYKEHEDLQDDNVTASADSGTGDPYTDGCGHGTHVAGTIAALTNNSKGVVGVLPNGKVALHIVKVFGNTCSWTYSSGLMAAVDKCVAANAHVVSMSLGGSFKSRFEERAFHDHYSNGLLSVAAAGNGGNTQKSYPASYGSVISVAAVDSTGTVASFSQRNDQVELAAPGVGVFSAVPWVSENSLTAEDSLYLGSYIENAAKGSVSGALVDGSLCRSGDFSVAPLSGAVVLCERGSISFLDKVTNVRNAGGSAAVIYNNAPGIFSGTLGTGSTSTIPAIGISQEDGILARAQTGTTGYVVSLVEPATKASGYEAWNGTSMATPHVSGVAALVWSHDTSWTNQQIRDALAFSAEDLGPAGRDNAYGYGLVQAKAALEYLGGGGSDDPVCIPADESANCSDGVDNDCDGLIDADDPDCQTGGDPDTCTLLPAGGSCSGNSECCSNKCTGKPGSKTCK